MTTYIKVNEEAVLRMYRRTTSKMEAVQLDPLISATTMEESAPPTVRQPEGYEVDIQWQE